MRNHTVRLYLTAATLFVFFVLWATVAAKPWASAARRPADPRLVALDRRQRRLRHESVTVKHLLDKRWAVYDRRLKERRAQIAAAERTHALQIAAAQAAAARYAASEAPVVTHAADGRTVTTYVTAPVSTAAAPAVAQPAATSATTVVTLPPQVQVVTLPPASAPATSSSSSKP